MCDVENCNNEVVWSYGSVCAVHKEIFIKCYWSSEPLNDEAIISENSDIMETTMWGDWNAWGRAWDLFWRDFNWSDK